MAKPIFIAKVNVPIEKLGGISEFLNKKLKGYHVLVVNDSEIKEASYECLNDCRGLIDTDIEKLIKDFNNGKK